MSPSCFTRAARNLGRTSGLLLVAAGSFVALPAQVKPASTVLAAWNSTGAAPQVAADQSTITLPAGGQLVRTNATGPLMVNIVSRPYFSTKVENRPILEVGPASLIFVRNENGGGVVMVGNEVVTLPSAIPLGADGRSVSALHFGLYVDDASSQAVLVLDGATYPFSVKAGIPQFEVAVSAGGEADWILDELEVVPNAALPAVATSASNERIAAASTNAQELTKAQTAAEASARAKDFADSRALFKARDLANAEKLLLKSNRGKAETLAYQLESAGKLTQMAFSLRQQYDQAGAMAVAQRALAILRDSDKLAAKASVGDQGQVYEMAAYLEEEILRDPDAAQADYDKALKANSESVRARAGLDRLEETKAKNVRLGIKG